MQTDLENLVVALGAMTTLITVSRDGLVYPIREKMALPAPVANYIPDQRNYRGLRDRNIVVRYHNQRRLVRRERS